MEHCKPAARGLLYFLSLLRAFLLNVIKRNQATTLFHSHKLVRVPQVCGVPAEVRAELARRRLSVVVASSDARCVAHAGKCCLCERLCSPVLDEDNDGAVLTIAFDRPWALVGAALFAKLIHVDPPNDAKLSTQPTR